MTNVNTAKTSGWRRGLRALRHSLRWRLVLLFLVLALFMSITMLASLQNALTLGWREAARPLLMDYVDHLAHDIGSPPSEVQAPSAGPALAHYCIHSGPRTQLAVASQPPTGCLESSQPAAARLGEGKVGR
jgi:hypothetical protein